ncbi:hypothetical protein GCM10023318_04050 [Nocardia callitridis]|uniref:Uncharacterized protein n=1 Tax=Nocardia callitridis TaxID=648753 RepID=A0ABP9JS27_9NOCA
MLIDCIRGTHRSDDRCFEPKIKLDEPKYSQPQADSAPVIPQHCSNEHGEPDEHRWQQKRDRYDLQKIKRHNYSHSHNIPEFAVQVRGGQATRTAIEGIPPGNDKILRAAEHARNAAAEARSAGTRYAVPKDLMAISFE